MAKSKRHIHVFILYIIVLAVLTLVPYKGSVQYEASYNLTLFKSINNYLKHMQNFGLINREAFQLLPFQFITFASRVFTVSFKNIMGNILLFFPFGFLLPSIVRKTSFTSVLFLSLVFSSLIEVIQYMYLVSRRADIDDVLLNILGALLGYVLHWIFIRIKKH